MKLVLGFRARTYRPIADTHTRRPQYALLSCTLSKDLIIVFGLLPCFFKKYYVHVYIRQKGFMYLRILGE